MQGTYVLGGDELGIGSEHKVALIRTFGDAHDRHYVLVQFVQYEAKVSHLLHVPELIKYPVEQVVHVAPVLVQYLHPAILLLHKNTLPVPSS